MMANQKIQIFADGACPGNPGPCGRCGHFVQGKTEKEPWGGQPDTTKNSMKFTSSIRGLEALNPASSIVLTTDLQYVRKGITESVKDWKVRDFKKPIKQWVNNRDLWERLDEVCGTYKMNWRWVKSHCGHLKNERADALANPGIDELGEGRCDK